MKTFYFGEIVKGSKAFIIDDWIELVLSPIGIFLAAIRLAEPFVWKTFKAEIKRALPCLKT